MRLKHKLLVQNEAGLHARPAAYIARLLHNCKSMVFFSCNTKKIDAKQVLEILLLQAQKNTWIDVEVQGEDAQNVLEKLTDAFACQFTGDV